MSKNEIVVGLDVGTTKACALVGEIRGGSRLEFLGRGVAPCHGLRKGRVVDLADTAQAIRAAVDHAARAAEVEIGSVILSVSGDHLRGDNRRGRVVVAGGAVTAAHVAAAHTDARQSGLAPDRVALHNHPRQYWVDGQPGARDPVGLAARELQVETHLVTAAATALENLVRAVHRAGLDVEEMVVASLAAAYGALDETEWSAGTLVADIGGGTTDVVVCADGSLIHSASLPIGGDHLTNDLSIGLRVSRADAEELKLRHGTATAERVEAGEFVEVRTVGDSAPRDVPRRIVAEIIEPRAQELLRLIQQEMERAAVDGVPATRSVVLTGGGALLEGTVPLAREVLGVPVRLGAPRFPGPDGWPRALEQPYYSTAVGLLYQALLRRAGPEGIVVNGASPATGLWERFGRWLRERVRW